jgi:hypothetical protein
MPSKGAVIFDFSLGALAHRNATQARDVFDLYHLLHSKQQSTAISANAETRKLAEERLASLSFGDYQAQVLSFLVDTERTSFSSDTYWQVMLNTIAAYLRGSL